MQRFAFENIISLAQIMVKLDLRSKHFSIRGLFFKIRTLD